MLLLLLLVGYGVVFTLAMRSGDANTFSALVIGPVLLLATIPIAYRVARTAGDPALALIITAGLVVKFAGSVIRYVVLQQVYEIGDANRYHNVGSVLSEKFADGDYDFGSGQIVGTKFIGIVTGFMYMLTGPTKLGGFFVFAWLAFMGQLCFYLAFRTAVPTGDHRRYALLVFFLPSIVFWPASIGKDAWMAMSLGIGAFGAARVLRGRPGGLVLTGTGALAATMVRPHVAVLLVASFLVALLVQRRRAGARSAFATVVSIGAILLGGAFLAGYANDFLLEKLGTTNLTDALEVNELRTASGGSRFTPTAGSITGFPMSVVTVLFRPFPFEAHNTEALAASLEGLLMLGLVAFSVRRIAAAVRLVRRVPYVAMAVAYFSVFAFTFSSHANFGLLARQRVQALPFFLVLLAMRARRKRPDGSFEPPPALDEERPRGDDRVRVAVYVVAAAMAAGAAALSFI
jgi:hypothetical protein